MINAGHAALSDLYVKKTSQLQIQVEPLGPTTRFHYTFEFAAASCNWVSQSNLHLHQPNSEHVRICADALCYRYRGRVYLYMYK